MINDRRSLLLHTCRRSTWNHTTGCCASGIALKMIRGYSGTVPRDRMILAMSTSEHADLWQQSEAPQSELGCKSRRRLKLLKSPHRDAMLHDENHAFNITASAVLATTASHPYGEPENASHLIMVAVTWRVSNKSNWELTYLPSSVSLMTQPVSHFE